MHSTSIAVDERNDGEASLKPVEQMEKTKPQSKTKADGKDAKTSYQNGTSGSNRNLDHLHVLDDRTGENYLVPIVHNAINASDFKKIKASGNIQSYADQNENGIRVYDPGFVNTAVTTSNITYV